MLQGNLVVIARVEDDETLGNVETMKTINWGIPVKAEQAVVVRSLSASRGKRTMATCNYCYQFRWS
jgi:hypothetical protein